MKQKIGVVGLGRGFMAMGQSLRHHPDVALAAAADPSPEVRDRFSADFDLPTYESIEELCVQSDCDIVYIASPHQFHRSHVLTAAASHKHILLEKPIALTLADCDAIIEAVDRAGVAMVVGHTHAFDPPVQAMRQMIADGTYGKLRMINLWTYTDFLYRPRRPEELDTSAGGGILFNQLPHQMDIVRHVGGGLLKSVHARLGAWDDTRPTEGASVVMFEFQDGCFGSMTYSGYAHFLTSELNGGIGENGLQVDDTRYGSARRKLQELNDPDAEFLLKRGSGYAGKGLPDPSANTLHPTFGTLIATCDRADIRHLPAGVGIYADHCKTVQSVSLGRGSENRSSVVDELVDAIRSVAPPVHDGRWAKATLEACLAVAKSNETGLPVSLEHQVAVSNDKH
ncbi:Gfo/Idh/MocA family protein [Hoeflea sp.]|uniref:Gfo/Idh/MocA family protein n=1 Tax=Hoeflea sp. TaxID=1940281 RepID=UPI003B02DA7F